MIAAEIAGFSVRFCAGFLNFKAFPPTTATPFADAESRLLPSSSLSVSESCVFYFGKPPDRRDSNSELKTKALRFSGHGRAASSGSS